MAVKKYEREGYRDVFNSFLVRDAAYAGELELPVIRPEFTRPEKLISFSKAIAGNDFEGFVHFYENDEKIIRIWNNPKRYLPVLKRYAGVISPDFSVYRDMPLIEQCHQIYRGRAIAHWLQINDIHVIPNIRFGDRRTYKVSCEGISMPGVIAVGSVGCLRSKLDRKYFVDGVEFVVNFLKPNCLVVYGSAPVDVFGFCKNNGTEIIQFDSETKKAHDKEGC